VICFPPHLINVSAPPGKQGKAKTMPFKCFVNGLAEFSQLLLDFFHIADLQVTTHDAF